MDILLLVVMGISLVATLVGSLWLIVKAFGESVFWGLACLFVPGAQLAFVVRHWDEVRAPGALWGGGLACLVLSSLAVPSALGRYRQEPVDRGADARGGPADRSSAAADRAAAAAIAQAAACGAADPVNDGFARWCCNGVEWKVMTQRCSQLTRPTESCGDGNRGTATLVACSTLGGDPRRRLR